jgi:hypothetical protein
MIGPTQLPNAFRPAQAFLPAETVSRVRVNTVIVEVLYAGKDESTQ